MASCVVCFMAHTPVTHREHVFVCVVPSRSLDQHLSTSPHLLPEVIEAAAAGRLLWSWLEVLVVFWVGRRLRVNVSILTSSDTLTDRTQIYGLWGKVQEYSQIYAAKETLRR